MSTLNELTNFQRDHYLRVAQYLESLYLTINGNGPESAESLYAANPDESSILTAGLTTSALNAVGAVIFDNQEDAQRIAANVSFITTSELIMNDFDVDHSYTAANVLNDLFVQPSDLGYFIPEGLTHLEYVGVCFAAISIFVQHIAEDEGGKQGDLLAAAIGHSLEFHHALGGTGDLQFVKVWKNT